LAGLGAGWCDYAFPLVKKVFEPQRQEDALSYSDLESYKRLVEWLRGRDGIAASDRCYLPLLKLFLDAWGRAEPYTYFLNVFNLYEHASGQEKGAIEASIQEQVVVMDYDRCVSLLYAMARCHVDARQPLPEQAVLAAALFLAKEPGLAASFSEDVRVYLCEALLGRMSKEGISRTELARWAELLQCEHLRGVSL